MDIDSVSNEAKAPSMKKNVSHVLERQRSNRGTGILRELAADKWCDIKRHVNISGLERWRS